MQREAAPSGQPLDMLVANVVDSPLCVAQHRALGYAMEHTGTGGGNVQQIDTSDADEGSCRQCRSPAKTTGSPQLASLYHATQREKKM
jgi:hypothetical protein